MFIGQNRIELTAMTQNLYKRPPITEAVIQIIFVQPHDSSKLEKFIKKIKASYTDHKVQTSYDLDIDITNIQNNEPKAKATPHIVHRLTVSDMTQQLLLDETSLVVSQLAPYCGWELFIARFTRDWKVWKKTFGFVEIKQIGVRYINRIDIPISGPIMDFSHYVNIYPEIPGVLGPKSSYAIQIKIPINELKCILMLKSAVVKSPLLNHMSLVVDQDIVRIDELPQKDESIYSLLDEIHNKKNEVFESCITDKSRELFNT